MKKKLIAILAAATMVFAFVGCGSSQEEATEETTTAVEETTTEAPMETATEAATEAATEDIGVDKATEIALADAGLSEGDVTFTKQAPDIDDGVSIYEIEFTSGETKYEYDIEAATGKIFSRDTDSIYDD